MDEQQQTPTAGNPIYQETQEKNAKWLWFLIGLIIIGALVFAFVKGIGPLSKLKPSAQEETSPTPFEFSQTSPTPEASPGAEIDKSQAKIRVLNGSGKAGTASSVKDLLEGKGYKVVEIGNADNFDFEQTIVRFKESFKSFQEVLFSDLSDNYSVSVSSDDLTATDSADIEVIIGAK
jgi:hypothetical protein